MIIKRITLVLVKNELHKYIESILPLSDKEFFCRSTRVTLGFIYKHVLSRSTFLHMEHVSMHQQHYQVTEELSYFMTSQNLPASEILCNFVVAVRRSCGFTNALA